MRGLQKIPLKILTQMSLNILFNDTDQKQPSRRVLRNSWSKHFLETHKKTFMTETNSCQVPGFKSTYTTKLCCIKCFLKGIFHKFFSETSDWSSWKVEIFKNMRKKWSDLSRFFNERLFYKAQVMFVLSFENRADNNHLTISASKADSVVQI